MVSRRVFLARGGCALVSLGFAPSFLQRTVLAAGAPRRPKLLVVIFQRGAVDGLSVVAPYADGEYYRARPGIAIDRPGRPDGLLDLDGYFGLNPRLAPLKPLWDRRELAVVHACGSPEATRSHFDAQDYLETGTPGVKSTSDGWLNRYLQTRGNEDAPVPSIARPLRAVALAPQLPRMLQGRASAVAMNGLASFGVGGHVTGGFEAEYAQAADRVLNGVGRDAFDAMKALRGADPSRYTPERGAEYPRSAFGQALLQIAQLAKAGVGLEVAFAEAGGWDTHVNQGSTAGQLGTRLDDLARSVAALVTDLGDRMADTVIVTMSEFGRAVAENGNRGTDHGHGNAMLVAGGGVRGGHVLGRWPGLAPEARYDGRDLAVTTDFRDVFGDILVAHLGLASTDAVFPGYPFDPRRVPGLFT